jgi:protease II
MKNLIKYSNKSFFKRLKNLFGRNKQIENIENNNNEKSENNNLDYSKTKLNKDLINADNFNKEIINKKYELYDKGYERQEILKIDEEFGEVVKYSDFLEEGKDKFKTTLTKYYSETKHLEKNKEYMNLLNLVDTKSKQLYSTYKEEYKYNLEPTDDKWYKETIYSTKKDEIDELYTEDNIFRRKQSGFRSFKDEIEACEKDIKVPDHPAFPMKVTTPFESYTDYFQWLYNTNSNEYKVFKSQEKRYAFSSLLKHKLIERNLLEDFEESRMISNLSSMQISRNYIVFKKEHDGLSLHFVNSDSVEPEKRGNIRLGDYRAKEVFGLKDFIELNTKYTDVNFLDFTKKLLEAVENDRDCLYSFRLCPKEQFLVLFFDLKGDGKSFDVLIKDIANDILLPVVLYNCDFDIAFDKHDGFYYTQLDLFSRPCKIFRHQIGRAQIYDSLIYHDRNENLKLRVFNCNSNEYTYIEISTNYTPSVNEIWFKPTSDLNKIDFKCVKRMEKNIYYSIKYANNYFYMLTNKSDTYDKSLKKIFINPQKIAGLLEHSKVDIKSDSNEEAVPDNNTALTTLSSIISTNDSKAEIKDYLSDLINNSNSLILPSVQDIIKTEDYINIIDFQSFKNYLVILEEIEKRCQFKIINLFTNNTYIHEPVLDNMNIRLQDNNAYDSYYFRYTVSSPIQPETTIDYSLGTRKSYTVHQGQFKKFDPTKYKSETMYIDDRNKEVKIPVILNYREDLYTSDSPHILYTKGSQSKKNDLEFNDMLVKLMDRGFVWVIPQVRGTNYFDFDWYSQGIAEHKLKHFTDFMDVAFFFIDNGAAGKLILYSEDYSGSVTASVALIQNPDLYSLSVFSNSAFDVYDLCMNNLGVSIVEEFGDINNKDFYETMKLYSPYHSILPEKYGPVLVSHTEGYKYKTQAYKFVAKMRKKNKLMKNTSNKIFLNEFPSVYTVEEKNAFIYSFIIGNTFFNNKS